MNLPLHTLDIVVLLAYFGIVSFLGIVVGKKQTKTLSDFYIAGGKWGPVVAFVFVFASAVGGAEAVVVGAGAYRSGLSGVWYWWNALFGTVIYFLFSTVYKRSRVFNLADFFEMRYGRQVATLYAVVGVGVCILAVGTFELAVGKIISGLSGLSVNQAVLLASVVVAFYVASGGQMSSLLTDLFQGILALTAFSFLLLPYLWEAAGGFEGLRTLPPETWSLESDELTVSYIVALSFSASVGSIVAPYLFGWIVIGKDERTATQCAWGHIWKRVVTLLFALYGILFMVYKPGLDDPEMAWGIVMKELLPPGLLGLLIASFFSALMSTADTMATAGSALIADHLFRKRLLPRRPANVYLRVARISAFATVFAAYLITYYFSTIVQFLEAVYSFVSFLSVPLYCGIIWRRANRQGMWVGFVVGVTLFAMCHWWGASFETIVFLPTIASAVALVLVSRLTQPESDVLLNRFYSILNTPVGQDARLRKVGVRLPATSEGHIGSPATPDETLDVPALNDLYHSYARHKVFGRDSSIEILKEPGLDWYYRGVVWVLVTCLFLLGAAWLGGRIMATTSYT